ncbi:DUF6685 family protein [Paraburkholderia sp. C35]|uniref:DUF6685 family protein n=1 Tax=Paraburkholderia sp. C35 TaxID=2126993 RepID=UPI000D69C6BD|nr:DUF6685 family protein [Paraburkholderia sp. C35]
MTDNPIRPVTEDELKRIPASVYGRESWSTWRRALNRPTPAVRARMTAWIHLDRMLESIRHEAKFSLPGTRKPGIFYDSSVFVDFMDEYGDGPFTLDGIVAQGAIGRASRRSSPAGKLAIHRTVPRFSFDIRDVDAIGHSQSDQTVFPTIRSFGYDYLTFMRESIDTDGLIRMLDHREIRILGREPTDSVGMRLWDGRLFLRNGGGSHHFAGAAYIAAANGVCVALTSQLNITEFNEPVIEWLLEGFAIFVVPRHLSAKLVKATVQITGVCYARDLPEAIARDETLIFLPKTSANASLVIDALNKAGLADAAPWLAACLADQRENRALLAERFPGLKAQQP